MIVLSLYVAVGTLTFIFTVGVVAMALRGVGNLTMMRAFSCSGIQCDVHRIPRPAWLKFFRILVPTRRFKCDYCNKKFVRLKPKDLG